MKLLVLGGAGMLGGMCVAVFRAAGFDVFAPHSHELNITDTVAIKRYVEEKNISTVLNCAVFKDFNLYANWNNGISINAGGPIILSLLAQEMGFYFIQISTDALFHGLPGPFFETSATNIVGPYACSKSGGETSEALVIRGSFIGPGKTSKPSLMERLRNGEVVNASRGEQWNGLTSLEFAECLLEHLGSGLRIRGTRHVFGPSMNKWDLVTQIKSQYKWPGVVNETNREIDFRLGSIFDDMQSRVPNESFYERLVRLKEKGSELNQWF